MRPKTKTFTLATVSTTGFATGLTGVGPFTTFTLTACTDGLAHNVTLTSGANLSAITLTVVGTDQDGRTQTEAIVGPNANTVNGTKFFATIVSITAGATLGANTMDVGWGQLVSSVTFPLDTHGLAAATYQVGVTGTVNITVQETVSDILNPVTTSPFVWVALSALTSKTANTIAQGTVGTTASRLLVNSYSTGAILSYTVNQATQTY